MNQAVDEAVVVRMNPLLPALFSRPLFSMFVLNQLRDVTDSATILRILSGVLALASIKLEQRTNPIFDQPEFRSRVMFALAASRFDLMLTSGESRMR